MSRLEIATAQLQHSQERTAALSREVMEQREAIDSLRREVAGLKARNLNLTESYESKADLVVSLRETIARLDDKLEKVRNG